MPRFREPLQDRRQTLLFAPSLDEWVGQDDEVRLLDAAMNELDWSGLASSYSELGRPAYDPRILARVLVYAYSKGVRSSRKIEELVGNDVRFMWLAEGEKPDFHTIARFRKEKFGELGSLFMESVRLCARAGLVLLRAVAVDGSKIRADVSWSSLYSAERLDREREAIERILQEAEDVDAQEDAVYGASNGRELPEDMKDAVTRRAKLAELAKQLREEGQKRVSATDPECRMMKCGHDIAPCYNVQIGVDASNQVIIAASVTSAQSDNEQLPAVVDEVEHSTGMSADVVLADAGYSSENTLQALAQRGQEALIPPSGDPRDSRLSKLALGSEKFVLDRERDVLICPAGRDLEFKRESGKGAATYRRYAARGCRGCRLYAQCVPSGRGSRRVDRSVIADLRQAMRDKLASPEGIHLYAARQVTVEPVFGRIKHNWGFQRFLLRGRKGAASEIYLVATAHNLMKWAAACLNNALANPELRERNGWTCGFVAAGPQYC